MNLVAALRLRVYSWAVAQKNVLHKKDLWGKELQ